MRVAFLSFDFGEYCIRLASALAKESEVLLMLPENQAAPHLSMLSPQVKFHPFNRPRFRQPLRQLEMVRDLVGAIDRFRPDVLHVQQGHLWFNFALPLLGRYPLVVTVHDPRQHVGDRNAQKTPEVVRSIPFRRSRQLIVHAMPSREEIVERLGIPEDRVHVIPHIVLGEGDPASRDREEEHTVLFFGRIWEYKGLEYLIRAEPLVSQKLGDVRIVVAGEGEDFDRYRRMMVHPEHFEVHNEYVPDDERAELFRRASVVVLPYVDASQSGVIPLAYSFGKPVVATTVGGLPEMVDEGRTGFLVPARDAVALADAIITLLRDRDLRHRMGEAGRRKINTECSADLVAERTLEVYRLALGEGSANSSLGSGSREEVVSGRLDRS